MCILIDLRCCVKLFSTKKNYFPTDLPEKISKSHWKRQYFFVRPNRQVGKSYFGLLKVIQVGREKLTCANL